MPLFLETICITLTCWLAVPPQALWRTIDAHGYLGQQMLDKKETYLDLNKLLWQWASVEVGWFTLRVIWSKQAGSAVQALVMGIYLSPWWLCKCDKVREKIAQHTAKILG